jgi:hypothetical protein
MILKSLKWFLLTGLVAAAVPAAAYSPEPRPHTQWSVGVDLGNVHIALGNARPLYRPTRVLRVDHVLLRRGESLEAQGHALVREGRHLERRGHRRHRFHMVREGERLQAEGYALIQRGRDMQYRARNSYAMVY